MLLCMLTDIQEAKESFDRPEKDLNHRLKLSEGFFLSFERLPQACCIVMCLR